MVLNKNLGTSVVKRCPSRKHHSHLNFFQDLNIHTFANSECPNPRHNCSDHLPNDDNFRHVQECTLRLPKKLAWQLIFGSIFSVKSIVPQLFDGESQFHLISNNSHKL